MKTIRMISKSLTLLGGATAATGPFYKGINVRMHEETGENFKTRDQWFEAFRRIKNLPTNFTAVRIYSTEEGNYSPLPHIFDAAQTHGLDLLLGLYLDNATGTTSDYAINQGRFAVQFDQLRQGLEHASTSGALDGIIGISVGNEDFYDNKQRPEDVAAMIEKVQDYLSTSFPGRCIPVGHTDTYSEVMNDRNSKVAEVADFLAANSFPFWENKPVDQAAEQFKTSMLKMDEVSKKYDIPIFIGETGWPIDGQSGAVQGSVLGLQTYWEEVVCSDMFLNRHAWFYIDNDTGENPNGGPHWGILDELGNPRIDLACPGPGPVL